MCFSCVITFDNNINESQYSRLSTTLKVIELSKPKELKSFFSVQISCLELEKKECYYVSG